jgi:hypothetical protein
LEGKEWQIRNASKLDLFRIAVRGAQVIWVDREQQVKPARNGCEKAPSLFSGSFDGKNLTLDWTFSPLFCRSYKGEMLLWETGVRYTSTLQLNSDGSLSGTYTVYATSWKKLGTIISDSSTLADPPKTDKADGVCIKCQ